MLERVGKLHGEMLKREVLDAASEAGGTCPKQYGPTAGKLYNQLVKTAKLRQRATISPETFAWSLP